MDGFLKIHRDGEDNYFQQLDDLTNTSFGLVQSPKDVVPSFRFESTDTVTKFEVRTICIQENEKVQLDIQDVPDIGFIKTDPSLGLKYANFGQKIPTNLEPGLYDLKITTSGEVFYSEPFQTTDESGALTGIGFMTIEGATTPFTVS